ncbi:MAG TPA: DUF1801 domain-containing protein [Gemmatimonadaceae bacterium]
MAETTAAQVKAYIASKPPEARRRLKAMRKAIKDAEPRAVEHFSYGIPGFKLDGKPLAWYGAWKSHMSMYPLSAGMATGNENAIKSYKTAKGTIQFPLDEPLPLTLIGRLVKARAKQIRKEA